MNIISYQNIIGNYNKYSKMRSYFFIISHQNAIKNYNDTFY